MCRLQHTHEVFLMSYEVLNILNGAWHSVLCR